MRRLRTFLVDELLLAQAVPGLLLCVGWAVMYEIYHEDGSFYTTLMQEILGGVRSACTYVGARRLRELSKRTTFVRVAQQSNEVFGRS